MKGNQSSSIRKSLTIYESQQRMIDELKDVGIIGEGGAFEGESDLFRYAIEDIFEDIDSPRRIEKELLEEEIRKLEDKKEHLKEGIEDSEEKEKDNSLDDYFEEEVVEHIMEKKKKKTFREAFEEWEDGLRQKFTNDHHHISPKKFREKVSEAIDRKDLEASIN